MAKVFCGFLQCLRQSGP